MIHSKGLVIGLVLVSVILAGIPTVDARNCLNCDPSIEEALHGFTPTSWSWIDTPDSMTISTEGQICTNANLIKTCFADE